MVVFSNSRPVQLETNVIANALKAADERPITCVYPATASRNLRAESFLREMAQQSGGAFFIMQIDEFGNLYNMEKLIDDQNKPVKIKLPFFCPPVKQSSSECITNFSNFHDDQYSLTTRRYLKSNFSHLPVRSSFVPRKAPFWHYQNDNLLKSSSYFNHHY